MEEVNLLSEHQDETLEQGDLRMCKGLCLIEAAVLRTRAKETKGKEKQTLLSAANIAMRRALALDDILNQPV